MSAVAPPPTIRDTRRRTPDDPAFARLRDVTQAHLLASVRRYARELRRGHDQHSSAQSAFIQRHLALLREAYLAAHKAGQRDYWRTVSLTPKRWPLLDPDEYRMRRTLTYYGAVSVAKLASEGIAAWHASQVQAVKAPSMAQTRKLADSGDGDPLDAWVGSLGARIGLQADLTWSAGEDGYVAAGGGDHANPYDELWWDLEPVAKHCADCPDVAAGSPYSAPGTGANELDQTPGDGATECGANCKCSLRYAYMGGPAFYDWSDFFPPDMPAMDGVDSLRPSPPPISQSDQSRDYWQRFRPEAPPDEAPPAQVETQADQAADYFQRMFPDQAAEQAANADLSDAQKAALDSFRAWWQQWQYFRQMFPNAPDLFSQQISLDQLPPWDQLTAEQQRILQGMYDALEQWNEASAEAEAESGAQE